MIEVASRRRWWRPRTTSQKAFAALVASSLILLLAWLAAVILTERRLAEAMKWAEVEFGLSNDLDDFIPAPLPSEKNAMVPLDEAGALVAPLFQGLLPWFDQESFAARLKNHPQLEKLQTLDAVDRLLAEADRRPECAPTEPPARPWVFWGSAPHVNPRLLMDGESLVAWMLLRNGPPGAAVERSLRMLRLSRKWTAVEPFFGDVASNIGRRDRFVKVINAALRSSRFDARMHEAIDQEAAAQADCYDLAIRIFHLEKLKRLEDFNVQPDRSRAWWLVGPLAANDRLFIVDWYDLQMRSLKRPYAEVEPTLKAANDELWRISKHSLDRKLHPDSLSVTSHEARRVFDYHCGLTRILRIVNAMAARQDWNADPRSLGLPPDCLIDPITGNTPLHVKRSKDGPIVYSIGFDLENDGGTLTGNNIKGLDIGLGPTEK